MRCDLNATRTACRRTENCEWVYDSSSTGGEQEGKCVECAYTTQEQLGDTVFQFGAVGDADLEAAAAAMVARLSSVIGLVTGVDPVSVQTRFTNAGVVNLNWIQVCIVKQLRLQGHSVPWQRIATSVLTDILEEKCPLCLNGHAWNDTAVLTPCCQTMVHLRCARSCVRQTGKCPTCSQPLTLQNTLTATVASLGTTTAPAAAAHRPHRLRTFQVGLAPEDDPAFFMALLLVVTGYTVALSMGPEAAADLVQLEMQSPKVRELDDLLLRLTLKALAASPAWHLLALLHLVVAVFLLTFRHTATRHGKAWPLHLFSDKLRAVSPFV